MGSIDTNISGELALEYIWFWTQQGTLEGYWLFLNIIDPIWTNNTSSSLVAVPGTSYPDWIGDSIEYGPETDPDGNPTSRLLLDGQVNAAPIPEPSTFILLGGGLAGLAFVVRRRGKE